jgi:hypothetical protein
MGSMGGHRVLIAAVAVFAVLAVSCGGDDTPPASTPPNPSDGGSHPSNGGSHPSNGGSNPSNGGSSLAAAVASSDLSVGAPQRFELGIFQGGDQGTKLVTFGTIEMRFAYLGNGGGSPAPGPRATAAYVAAPGTTTGSGPPRLSDPNDARGVYEADNVEFALPGVWQVEATAAIDELGEQTVEAVFPVRPKPALPAPGDRALRTRNLTMASTGAPPEAIDSRALDGAPVPDPELHRWTIARAIAQHRPALVIFATPTYCVSRFCGPTVDGVEQLAKEYPTKAVYIHVEIWRHFDSDLSKAVANKAAADWLYRDGDLTEPWLYLIGADGVIKDRWGPLFDLDQVGRELAALPDMKG